MQIDLQGILNSKRLAVSRALSFVENSDELDLSLTEQLYKHLGSAYRIGVTGPPGAGKSTLVDLMIEKFRQEGKRVAVISVDPTSPFTGGAILGDRVRMGRHYSDRGVFIRSMATRGSRGGLALQTQEAADIFDAAGYDVIIFETVGVGQVELDVADAADTTLVILVPESGDDIQAMKAGLMEIADLFVMNKADRQGANQAFAQIKSMLETRSQVEQEWSPQVVKTSALQKDGLGTLLAGIADHRTFLEAGDGLHQNLRRRLRSRIRKYIEKRVLSDYWDSEREQKFTSLSELFLGNELGPVELVRELLKD